MKVYLLILILTAITFCSYYLPEPERPSGR
jgi:hypothetical protein